MVERLILTLACLCIGVLMICWPMFVPLVAYYTIREYKNADNREKANG